MHCFKMATSVVKWFHLRKHSDWSNHSFADYNETNMNLNQRSAKEYSAIKPLTVYKTTTLVFLVNTTFGIVRKHWKKPIASETLSNWPAQEMRHVEQPITAVGDKKLSTDFHTSLKTERLQKTGSETVSATNDR